MKGELPGEICPGMMASRWRGWFWRGLVVDAAAPALPLAFAALAFCFLEGMSGACDAIEGEGGHGVEVVRVEDCTVAFRSSAFVVQCLHAAAPRVHYAISEPTLNFAACDAWQGFVKVNVQDVICRFFYLTLRHLASFIAISLDEATVNILLAHLPRSPERLFQHR